MTDSHQPTAQGRARIAHAAGIRAMARTDHQHADGPERCPTCSTPAGTWACGQPDCELCGPNRRP